MDLPYSGPSNSGYSGSSSSTVSSRTMSYHQRPFHYPSSLAFVCPTTAFVPTDGRSALRQQCPTTTTTRKGVLDDVFQNPGTAIPQQQQQGRRGYNPLMMMTLLTSNKINHHCRSVTIPFTTSNGPSFGIPRRRNKRPRSDKWRNINGSDIALQSSKDNDDKDTGENLDDEDDESEEKFLKRALTRIESLEDVLAEIEEYCLIEGMCDDDSDDDEDDNNIGVGGPDDEDMDELFSLLQETDPSGIYQLDDDENENDDDRYIPELASVGLEQALLQGVVPANAQVGGDTLPGDWGFDPLRLAERDYIHQAQYRFLSILPGGNPKNDPPPRPRPPALVLRDYREAEIRHGRLAMLAAVIWPLQEKVDKFVLDEEQFGPIIYGPVTLPYFPLIMTLIMMLLGYLDIYAKAIKEEEGIGDAFLPGDCFWDPLRVLEGAPPSMKRNMQERELFNGRVAMVAFAAFVFEEATSHQALIDITSNELLFVPAYQIPFIQEWLDGQFGTYYHH